MMVDTPETSLARPRFDAEVCAIDDRNDRTSVAYALRCRWVTMLSVSVVLAAIAEDNGDAWRKPGDVCPTDKFDYVYVDFQDTGSRRRPTPSQ